MSAELVIRRLRPETGEATKRAIDRLLARARSALVRREEALASAEERASDAAGDATRIVLYARLLPPGRTVGIADAVLHVPEPGDVTISQLVVAARARKQGVGRALVAAVLARARKRGALAAGTSVYAAVLPGNNAAIAFWERLGLSVVERGRRSIILARLAADGESE